MVKECAATGVTVFDTDNEVLAKEYDKGGWNLSFGITSMDCDKHVSRFTLKYIESEMGQKQVTVGSLWKLTGMMNSVNFGVEYRRIKATKWKFKLN